MIHYDARRDSHQKQAWPGQCRWSWIIPPLVQWNPGPWTELFHVSLDIGFLIL